MLSGIPEATNRKAILLIVEISTYNAIGVTQAEAPGKVYVVDRVGNDSYYWWALRRTPPETDAANIAESTKVDTETARKTLKAAAVAAITVFIPTMF